jgi:hypothetical protein
MLSFFKKWSANRKWKKAVRRSQNEFFKDDERFKKLTHEEFRLLEDDKLFQAAISWIFGKTQIIAPTRHLEILEVLPLPCQVVIAVNAVDGEINNGGFNQYYFNESHILTIEASDALSAIGASRLSAIAKRADWTYQQIKGQLGNRKESTMEEFMASYENNPLNDFDTEYYAASESESVYELLVLYIKENIDCFGD